MFTGAGPLRHVLSVEEVLINALRDLGASDPGRLRGYPGVWVDASSENPRKIAAIGVRVARKRTLHGFALNVTTDMAYMREHIVACGIPDRPVTSLAEEGLTVSMSDVVAAVSRAAEAQCAALRRELESASHEAEKAATVHQHELAAEKAKVLEAAAEVRERVREERTGRRIDRCP